MTYGVVPEGFARKPLSVILAELEAGMITEFGPGVIQTPQSPLGQLNGLMADLVTQLWERAEDVYQSYDPDQAEGTRLEILGRLRLLERTEGETDEAFRQAITNTGRARIDLQDIARAVAGVPGVTYSQVFLNDTGQLDEIGLDGHTIVIAVMGGDDEAIATIARQYIVPGIDTYGNTVVSTVIDGFCRTINLLRPIPVPVELIIHVNLFNDRLGCPPPSTTAIRTLVANELELLNGDDVTVYRVRQVIESAFNTVEVRSIEVTRAGSEDLSSSIGFVEIAVVTFDNITVVVDD